MNTGALYPSMAPEPAAPPPAETLITAPPVQPVEPAAPKPAAEPPAAPPLSEEARLAASGARLFDKEPEAFVDSNAPEEVKALREADGARKMYSPQELFKNDLPDAVFEAVVGNVAADGTPLTQEQAVQAAGVWREIAADLELSTADVAALVPVFKNPPSPEQQAANRSASMAWLVAEHGDRAGQVLELAQALVARDPRTAALLDFGGGDDPRVVKRVVAAALRQAASGRLKLKK